MNATAPRAPRSRSRLLPLLLASWACYPPRAPARQKATFCMQDRNCRLNWAPSARGRRPWGLPRPGKLGRPAEPPTPVEQGTNNDNKQLSSPLKAGLNVLKSLLGSGNLALPSAIAAFSGSRKAVVPATAVSLVFSLLSAYGFVLISRICEATKADNYQDAWSRTVSVRSSWMPAIAVLVKTWIACVSYLMIIGDCTSMVLLPMGFPPRLAGRNPVIVLVASFVLLPLCCLKSMAALAKFSVIGILSAFYCMFVIAFRYASGSYTSGALLAAAPFSPKFSSFGGNAMMTAATPASTVLIATLAYAYTAHYGAPQIYSELEPGPDGTRASRMRQLTYTAFLGGWVFFSTVMVCGFLTFGDSSQGMVLNNYALTDQLLVLARLALSLSMLTSFPIIFTSFRAGLISAMGASAEKFQQSRPITLASLLLLTIVPAALGLRDLGKLAALSGAVLASFIVYVAPSLMAIRARRRGLLVSNGIEKALQFMLVPAGILLGIVGAVQSLR